MRNLTILALVFVGMVAGCGKAPDRVASICDTEPCAPIYPISESMGCPENQTNECICSVPGPRDNWTCTPTGRHRGADGTWQN
jgi:hypothetical protein